LFGLLAVDDGRTFGDGVVDAIRLWGWLLALLVTERLIRSLPVRFVVLALSMVAITAVEQLIFDGRATWTAAAWSVALAAVFTVIQLAFAAVSRRQAAT
jgi:hypothetical protein